MSLLRTERLSVALTPTHVGIAIGGGWMRSQSNRTSIDVKPQGDGRPAWQGSLDGLANWLDTQKRPRAKTTLILSNRFVRFALAPWSEAAGRPDEDRELALACLEGRYGDMAGWMVQLDAARYRQPRIVCAVESALMDGTRALFRKHGLVCDSVAPAFVAGWNHCRTRLAKAMVRGDGLFAIVESDMLVMATRRAGNWHSARATALRTGFREVPTLLEREGLLQGFSEPPATWLALPVAERHARAIEAGNKALRIVGAGNECQSAVALAVWGAGR